MNTSIIKISTILIFLLSVLPTMAQGAPPGTPIDGGLGILLAAGGAYGIKKMMKKKND